MATGAVILLNLANMGYLIFRVRRTMHRYHQVYLANQRLIEILRPTWLTEYARLHQQGLREERELRLRKRETETRTEAIIGVETRQ